MSARSSADRDGGLARVSDPCGEVGQYCAPRSCSLGEGRIARWCWARAHIVIWAADRAVSRNLIGDLKQSHMLPP